MKGYYFFMLLFMVFSGNVSTSTSYAAETAILSKGQTIYVPAYSHIYAGNREIPILLTVTLSIRNIDRNSSIKVTSVDYFETQGTLLKKFIDSAAILKPLGSTRYIIPQKDKSGGSGANFIVTWESDKLVNSPIVETIMIGAESNQGISFTSRGQVITETE
ncbi:MAG: DUF3124 domain-containing protein [Thermodesulfobacteriota bacterium]